MLGKRMTANQSTAGRPDSRKADTQPVVGIIGAIGSGKSAVANAFERLGLRLIDADRIAHEVLRDASVKSEIEDRFGARVIGADGEVDRGKLGAIVFEPAGDLASLEAIVHPRVRVEIERLLASARSDDGVPGVVLDAPLLLEAGLDRLCDYIVLVEVDEDRRRQRVAENRGWTAEELKRREEFQKDLNEKIKVADYKMDNNHSIRTLGSRVEAIWSEIVARSRQ